MNDFRLYLQEELVRRCKENPQYSLRAFAKQLEIEPSFLSKLLSQKRAITKTTLVKMANKLALSPEQITDFSIQGKTQNNLEYNQLTIDSFKVIADWYHYALLELITIKNINHDHKNLARSLNISVIEVKDALERLERLQMVKKNLKGQYSLQSNNSTLSMDFTSGAQKKLQKQILERAILALDEIPYEQRVQNSVTMSISTKKLKKAKAQILEFQRQLTQFLNEGEKCDQVYHLSLSLYPVTNITHNKH